MRYPSPLRYPGGKAGLSSFLSSVITQNDLQGCPYYEPYAGGAGAALGLIHSGMVSELFLNDADYRIYAFWFAALQETQRFIDRIEEVPLSMTEWHSQRAISCQPQLHEIFEVGFSTFFMNRCNRSGVVSGAGPIGGWGQDGDWRLDARFNRESLAKRILQLASFKNSIVLSCLDAPEFLKKKLPKGKGRHGVFVYLDPPYVKKGKRLYLNSYTVRDHQNLARYIQQQVVLPWIMSYDDHDLIRQLYGDCRIISLPIKYSLQEKRIASELIIAPNHVNYTVKNI